ncbi:MAG: hypothetical protein M3Q95_12260 [Bacteroidota bacterium]|nr:hypothetical protein [Bacteroidota bacterium]
MRKLKASLIIAVFALGACSAPKPFYGTGEKKWSEKSLPDHPVKYSVFLMGGFDYEESRTQESFDLLTRIWNPDDTAQAVVFLNDRVYKKRNQKADNIGKTMAAKKLDSQLEHLKESKGKIYFIAGHDQAKGKRNYTPGDVKKYVEKKLDRKDLFYPKDGCPGPDDIELTDDLLLITVNNDYWLWDKKKDHPDCEVEDTEEWLEELEEVIDDNQRKNLLVVGHHPAINLGNYGGWFSLRQHIFPLTELNKNLYIPLPVIGTLYPITRIALGLRKDKAYPPNKKLSRSLIRTFYKYDNVVYASGLEQNFQYFKYHDQDYIVTNSADEVTWTGRIRSKFTYPENGLTKLTYFENGEVWMEYYAAGKDTSENSVVFRKQLKSNDYRMPFDSTAISSRKNVSDSTITLVANRELKAGGFKKILLGEHYRGAWTAPVRVPLIDLQKEQGGLEITKKGGGNQTKSLHLLNKKGEELTLRSVVKYPENLLGPMMTNTLAADVVKDQTSSIHPYTPFVIDNLSDVAGILHSDPKIVFIPNDEQLQEYREEFANTLAIFEKKADGNMASVDNFLYVEKAIGSDNLMKLQKKENNTYIDDYALLKSRLFDMWINDWDRHQGQWRWGKVECDENRMARCKKLNAKKEYYIPIPKDRDQAFARFDGVIPWIAGRRWVARRFQHFSNEVKDVTGLNYNARNFDHAFLSRLSREDWNRISSELQQELTDKKIENAIRQFPDTIYKIDGQDMINTLKARRNNMSSFTNRYYDFLSRNVDVRGSNEREVFIISRINDDSTQVKMYDSKAVEENLLYSRTFITGETKEVRIYGGDGDDVFDVKGKVNNSIIVRIIGGKGNDSIVDQSFVKRGCRKTVIYDEKKKNEINFGRESKNMTSKSSSVNDYEYDSHPYDLIAPATFFGYNRDDGVFLGGGVLLKKQGFRKEPYAYMQRLVANVALNEKSFNLRYLGDFIKVFGVWGIHAEAEVLAPRSTTNFYGLGNETVRLVDDDDFYRLRYNNVFVYPGFKRIIRKSHSVKIGPIYEYIRVDRTEGRFITSLQGTPYLGQAVARNLGGVKLEYEIQSIDDSVLTFRGIKWRLAAVTQTSLDGDDYNTTNIESNINIYVPIANRATIAIRLGGATRLGDYDFFQANTLGGYTLNRESGNLRGHLRGRFSGQTVAYVNTDLRVKLFTFKTYLFPSHFGIMGFYDTGRVWVQNDNSDKWHNGFGGGVWIDPFARTIINLNYAVSKEEKLVTLAIGFLF